jgi:manganese/zinc/iron transport system permease protein
MTIQQLEIQLIASVVAVACSLVGVFLVLRRMAMMSDAISHTVLLGIVVTFFLVQDLGSSPLILGAAATGVLTISLVEVLNKTRLVKEDAAIGLVFPALFSVAVILISRFAGNVHLDSDSVLLGELAFAPFDRFELFGLDLGPKALVVMGAILLLNLLFIILFYKELKLATFDAGLAATLGFLPGAIHYGLMTLVSVTAVGAFDAVGSILVVAMMIGPAASAYLLTDHLPRMLGLGALIGVLSAVSGYWLAHWLDASIAGSMATMIGVLFLAAFFFAPQRGMIALARRRSRQKWEFAQRMLVIHLLNHENSPQAEEESRVEHMHLHMRWEPGFASSVIARSVRAEWVVQQNGHVYLTATGRKAAREAMIG